MTPAATLAASITAAEAQADATLRNAVVFVFGGNTYVTLDIAVANASASNTTLVQLAGVHTFTAGAGLITVLT